MTSSAIQFLVPLPEHIVAPVDLSVESYWAWISKQEEIESWGPYSWTLQTYLHLKRGGIECRLVQEMPTEGIVIAHRDFIPDGFVPSRRLYLACILADREQDGFSGHHEGAQFHIVQNPFDRKLRTPKADWPAAFVPYWPQPGLLSRDERRGERFDVAAFFGYPHNLAWELREPDWSARLSELGMVWHAAHRSQWHDYREVDAVVAVREFGGAGTFDYKPPSKLHNAWRAGVPAILGPESAYRAWRESNLDYIEVQSIDEVLDALRRLKVDRSLRAAMVRNGLDRAKDVSVERLTANWLGLLDDLVARWRAWCDTPERDQTHFFERRSEVRQAGLPSGRSSRHAGADIVIIGSGFAAYELTRTLVAHGRSVVIAERGDRHSYRSAALSAIAHRREPIQSGGVRFGSAPEGFESLARYVGLGGTSALWSGKLRRLDQIDVTRTQAGRCWPIDFRELERWYDAVAHDYGWPDWSTDVAFDQFAGDAAHHGLRLVEIFDQNPPLRLQDRWATFPTDAVRFVYGADVVGSLYEPSRDRLSGVRVSVNGSVSELRARHIAVACGGIASVSVGHVLRPGNGASSRSTYEGFMDHPKAIVASIMPRGRSEFFQYLSLAHSRTRRLVAISLPEAELAPQHLGNHTAFLWSTDDPTSPIRVTLSAEQFPETENGVLSTSPPIVRWRVSRATRLNADSFLSLLIPRLEQFIGPVTRLDDREWRGASHHLGALPMGRGNSGIVDESCRFHDVDNLYCVSSAVFPTAGSANPTLTIVALARRLGEHLVAGS